MNDFNDQKNQQGDFQLGSRLAQHIKKQRTVRLLLSLVLVISMILIWAMNWDENTDVLLALGLFIGILGGLHISARWQLSLIIQAAKRLQNR